MKANRFLKRLDAGEVPTGHMLFEFGTRGIAKILEAVDIDFVVIDMEHTGFDADRIGDLLAWFKATGIAPFVRVPQGLYHFIARTMDAGALGIMVGNVETAAQARQIVDAVKYSPLGKRGVGLGTAHTDYVVPDPIAYFEFSNRNTTVICQIESPVGLENLDAIAATPGVDVLWVGHFDLSQSMGIPAQFQHPRFREALESVVRAAKKAGKHAAIQPSTRAMAEEWLGMGFNIMSWSSDVAVYRDALRSELQMLKELIKTAPDGRRDG